MDLDEMAQFISRIAPTTEQIVAKLGLIDAAHAEELVPRLYNATVNSVSKHRVGHITDRSILSALRIAFPSLDVQDLVCNRAAEASAASGKSSQGTDGVAETERMETNTEVETAFEIEVDSTSGTPTSLATAVRGLGNRRDRPVTSTPNRDRCSEREAPGSALHRTESTGGSPNLNAGSANSCDLENVEESPHSKTMTASGQSSSPGDRVLLERLRDNQSDDSGEEDPLPRNSARKMGRDKGATISTGQKVVTWQHRAGSATSESEHEGAPLKNASKRPATAATGGVWRRGITAARRRQRLDDELYRPDSEDEETPSSEGSWTPTSEDAIAGWDGRVQKKRRLRSRVRGAEGLADGTSSDDEAAPPRRSSRQRTNSCRKRAVKSANGVQQAAEIRSGTVHQHWSTGSEAEGTSSGASEPVERTLKSLPTRRTPRFRGRPAITTGAQRDSRGRYVARRGQKVNVGKDDGGDTTDADGHEHHVVVPRRVSIPVRSPLVVLEKLVLLPVHSTSTKAKEDPGVPERASKASRGADAASTTSSPCRRRKDGAEGSASPKRSRTAPSETRGSGADFGSTCLRKKKRLAGKLDSPGKSGSETQMSNEGQRYTADEESDVRSESSPLQPPRRERRAAAEKTEVLQISKDSDTPESVPRTGLDDTERESSDLLATPEVTNKRSKATTGAKESASSKEVEMQTGAKDATVAALPKPRPCGSVHGRRSPKRRSPRLRERGAPPEGGPASDGEGGGPSPGRNEETTERRTPPTNASGTAPATEAGDGGPAGWMSKGVVEPLKKPRRCFTRLQEEALVHGVLKYGTSNWKVILDKGWFDGRGSRELQDKYRNLEKYRHLAELEACVHRKLTQGISPMRELRRANEEAGKRPPGEPPGAQVRYEPLVARRATQFQNAGQNLQGSSQTDATGELQGTKERQRSPRTSGGVPPAATKRSSKPPSPPREDRSEQNLTSPKKPRRRLQVIESDSSDADTAEQHPPATRHADRARNTMEERPEPTLQDSIGAENARPRIGKQTFSLGTGHERNGSPRKGAEPAAEVSDNASSPTSLSLSRGPGGSPRENAEPVPQDSLIDDDAPWGKRPQLRRKAALFSKLEEEALVHGVILYGKGHWAIIKRDGGFYNRSVINLSDKYRNLKKYNHLYGLQQAVKEKIAAGEDPLRKLREFNAKR